MIIFMGKTMVTKNEVFLDTAYAVALSSPNDQYYERANELADELEYEETTLITTRAVIFEIGNAMAKQRHRKDAITLLNSIKDDEKIEIIPISEELYVRAEKLFCERPDKEWSLTDCVSFVVMNDLGLTEALTPDEHFTQAGFRILMT